MKSWIKNWLDIPDYTKRDILVLEQAFEALNKKLVEHEDELYEHRIELYIALCKYHSWLKGAQVDGGVWKGHDVWRSKEHFDGSSFADWFILGINKEPGKQITYHLPMSKWGETDFAETLDKALEWDGHISSDVIERLKQL